MSVEDSIVIKAAPKLLSRNTKNIPEELLNNEELNRAIDKSLPFNYNFEIHKTIWRIKQEKAKVVGLQMPEGILFYSTQIAQILEQFADVDVITLGDVTYGACCIDDLTASRMGIDFLVHYGHSCLVPTDDILAATNVKTMYVFVDIAFDAEHLASTILHNFKPEDKITYMGTIQFSSTLFLAKQHVLNKNPNFDIMVPQEKPLTSGEVLGCTSPKLPENRIVIFVADGRFHLESAMIQNPKVQFFRYDPFMKQLFHEEYTHNEMKTNRRAAIETARSAQVVCLVLGTLGRQGSVGIIERLLDVLDKRSNLTYFVVLLSEISQDRLNHLDKSVDCYIQVACPRLSIDWGHLFKKPVLSPFEGHVTFGDEQFPDVYPMDFYSEAGGKWANYGGPRSGSLGANQLDTQAKRRAALKARLAARKAAQGGALSHKGDCQSDKVDCGSNLCCSSVGRVVMVEMETKEE